MHLHSDQVAPVALIIAELFSNALEHAFIGRTNKWIGLTIINRATEIMISVHDNGNGIPGGFDMTRVKSLGLKVANQLAQQQGGAISASNDHGARFVLAFRNRTDI